MQSPHPQSSPRQTCRVPSDGRGGGRGGRGLLGVALAISVLIHLLGIFGAAIPLPRQAEHQERLMVALLPKPSPILEPSPRPPQPAPSHTGKKQPKPHLPPPTGPRPASGLMTQAAPGIPMPTGEGGSPALTGPEPAAKPGTDIPPAPAEKPALPSPPPSPPREFPSQGRMLFDVAKGTQRFVVGRATLTWRLEPDNQYTLRLSAETVGLVSLFVSGEAEQVSKGRYGPDGLQPERYQMRKKGEDKESALFDWNRGVLQLSDPTREEPLQPGTQDLISFYFHFGWQPGWLASQGFDLPVTTGKKVENYHFRVIGEEDLDLAVGVAHTLHLQAAGEDTTDLWLDRERLLLPAKIRHTDKKGETYELLLSSVLATAPPGDAPDRAATPGAH